MVFGERIGITKIEYMRIVCSRLKEGGRYKVQTEDREDRETQGRRQRVKITKKMKVEKFYPNFVLFVDRKGLATCLSYPDTYKAIYGRENDDEEMAY